MQDNQIIDFQELFKEKETKQSPNNIKGYVFSIGTYLFIMFIVATLLFIALRNVSSLLETITPEDTIIALVNENSNRIVIVPENSIDTIQIIQSLEGYIDVLYASFTWIIPENAPFFQNNTLDVTLFKESIEYQETYSIIYFEDDFYSNINYDLDDMSILSTSYQTFSNFGLSLLNLILYVLLFIPIVFFLKPDLLYDIHAFKSYQQKIIGFVISGYIYVFLGNFIATTLVAIVQTVFGIETGPAINQAVIVEMLSSNGFIFTFLSAVLLGPIVEELVFRKAFFGIIKNQKIAIVVSSFLFGLIHVTSEPSLSTMLVQIIPYVTLGFVFGYLYIKHEKNIVIPIIVHMLSNFISIVLTLFI